MQKGLWKKMTCEDKFDRKYACWVHNHRGWRRFKAANRRTLRRKLKAAARNEQQDA